jgi:phosphate transport system protein
MEPMGRYYDENYELLRQKLESMAEKVRRTISQALDALTRGDLELAQEVIKADADIDFREIEIDELVLKLLALQQPMAIDLRFLVTALKINNDLERMGDQAVNIAQGLQILQHRPHDSYLSEFGRMEKIVQRMAQDAIQSFMTSNVELARDVIRRDDEVDAFNRNMIRALVSQAKTHPEHADACISLVLITRNLERIGDLSTNIAEDVVYYIEGRFIKHTRGLRAQWPVADAVGRA